MKKEYEKPVATEVTFRLNEELAADASYGTGNPPWATDDTGFNKNDYQR